MKFLICFALVLAVAQAHVIAGPAVTYTSAVLPAAYSTSYIRSAPVAYAAPAAVRTLPISTYATSAVYSAPSFYSVPALYSSAWRK